MPRKWKILIALVTAAAVAWAVGLVRFANAIPTEIADPETHTDAIVVLTGGSERIATGIALLAEGKADKLFISGVGEQVKVGDLTSRVDGAGADLSTRIAIGSAAADTPGNALETAAWAAREQVQSIRLVTAAYHMPRSMSEFSAVMPDVRIVPHPVFPANVRVDWWRWPGTASLIAREYTKYLVSELRLSIMAATMDAGP